MCESNYNSVHIAAVEALTKQETQDESQFTTKIAGKTSLGSSYFVLYLS
jgi:hypothetical protein